MVPRRFFWFFDLLSLCLAFLIAYLFVPRLSVFLAPGGLLRGIPWVEALSLPEGWNGVLPPFTGLLWILLVVSPTTILVLGVLKNHIPPLNQSYTRILFGGLVAPAAGLSLVALVLFALKDPYWSRLFVFSFAILSSIGLIVYRIALRFYAFRRRAAGYYAKNIALVGSPSAIDWMVKYFTESLSLPSNDYRLFGYLRLPADRPLSQLSTIPLLGEVEQLGDLLIHQPIHEVLAIHPVAGGDWIAQVIQDCDALGVLLRIVPEALLTERRTLQTLYLLEPLHLPAVVLAPPHWDSEAIFFKRLFDFVVSFILLLLLSPLFALIAIAIKLTTPHLPVLYRWRVVGRNGAEFTGYKFTTMMADADDQKANLQHHNEMTGPVFKMKKDPRVTPLGRFLRKYSLNELPQLWSVLKGDMSLVGPRPAFRHELDRYEFWHKRKLSIQPGMTCLWQVRGRNKISNFDDWVRMDLEYIDNWSLWLDFKILLRTAWAVVAGTGS